VKLFTIGFTKKPASKFFGLLRDSGAKRVVDVRLQNTSHLAGFAKQDDLAYFLREVCDMDYVHVPELAPTKELLDAYKKSKGSWEAYEQQFVNLMKQRRIEETVPREVLESGCLLCSEDQPHHCHRRLIAEYLSEHWSGVEVAHLT
jgi:uncharacterized protein (DUF488 family)